MAAIGGLGNGLGAAGVGQAQSLLRARHGAQEGGVSFADTLKNALGEVQTAQTDARDAIDAFLRGEPVEIHDVMAASEEAGIALDMLIEVRNKLADAYRTVMQMQA
jgi:flagellar hook-basal body complex protein FliE